MKTTTTKVSIRSGKTALAIMFWLLVIGVPFLTAVSGCGEKEPVKIGFVGGTSGKVADLGISGRDAVELVVDEWNRDGGINGHRIELLIEDDQQDPKIAIEAAMRLIDQKVVAIIGPMTSDMAVVTKPIFDEAKIVVVAPTVSSQLLSAKDDYFFRVCSTTLDNARKSASFHIENNGIKRISVIYDLKNRSYAENWLQNFKDYFEKHGGTVINETGINGSSYKSFKQISHDVLSAKPDGVLLIANSMDSAVLCQQLRKLAPDLPITLSDWSATERFLELGGKSVEGVTAVQLFDRNNPEKRYQIFRRAYMDRFKREPGFAGSLAYDSAQVVLKALQEQKNGQSLKQTILQLNQFQGLQKNFRFDNFGDVDRSNLAMAIVKNQKFVVLD